ncbi:sodium-dependent transporter [Streptomyces sp. NPDC014733]|uniref:sodium-dependent transporter n=1 Tax=Streptomyces sp. NPDC014733 TaxID=3364885 RepID=UPI0036F820B5
MKTAEPLLPRLSAWLHARLGRASLVSYAAALLVPGPGNALRDAGVQLAGVRAGLPAALLVTILFAAAYQVTPQRLAAGLRRPTVLVGGLVAHLATPFVVVAAAAALLAATGATRAAHFVPVALVLVTTAPVAAGATVWIGRGNGDGAAMISIVVCSALLSPLTLPATVGLLDATGLLDGGLPPFRDAVAGSARGLLAGTVMLPCAAGIVCRGIGPRTVGRRVLAAAPLVAMVAVLALTYVNAAAALPLLTAASVVPALLAVGSAGAACLLAFQVGHRAARLLRLPPEAAATVTLACGMSNVGVSSVLAATLLSAEPGVLLAALAYGLVQKVAAHRAMAGRLRQGPDRLPRGTRLPPSPQG